MGLLINLEGVDGCGKTTAAALVAERLRERGYTVAVTLYPSPTEIGNLARKRSGLVAAILHTADRCEQDPYLDELLDTHDVVISDRGVWSMLAYQYDEQREEELSVLLRMTRPPDMAFLFRAPIQVLQGRVRDRDGRLQPGELEVMEKADEAYQLTLPWVRSIGCAVVDVDATQPPEDVADLVMRKIAWRSLGIE